VSRGKHAHVPNGRLESGREQVAVDAAGKSKSARFLAGSRFGLNENPPGSRCAGGRGASVVARPGAVEPQQPHHVPVMLRCAVPTPGALTSVCGPNSVQFMGRFPYFSRMARSSARRSADKRNALSRRARADPGDDGGQ
jgi:hypothetical protein